MTQSAIGKIQKELATLTTRRMSINTKIEERSNLLTKDFSSKVLYAYFVSRHDLTDLCDLTNEVLQALLECKEMRQLIEVNEDLADKIEVVLRNERENIYGVKK